MIDIQPGIDRFHATLYLRGPTLSDFAQSSTSAELTQSSRRKVLGIRLQQAVNLQIVHQGVRDVGNAPFDAWLSTLIIFEDAWSHGLRSPRLHSIGRPFEPTFRRCQAKPQNCQFHPLKQKDLITLCLYIQD